MKSCCLLFQLVACFQYESDAFLTARNIIEVSPLETNAVSFETKMGCTHYVEIIPEVKFLRGLIKY